MVRVHPRSPDFYPHKQGLREGAFNLLYVNGTEIRRGQSLEMQGHNPDSILLRLPQVAAARMCNKKTALNLACASVD
jgi:hypothetical protein